MEQKAHALYAAFKTKDPRFDGRFFVGISSTGIYCRPVCRAKQPKPENCHFFETAALAEQAGYRPCLLCRPELAPGSARTDATATLAIRAAQLLEENCAGGYSVPALAARLGCTDRHLRRAFAAQYGVTPVQYLQTCRLLLAKSLLTDTDLSVLDVAMTAGFGSLRRFNDLFRSQYKLSPTALRRQSAHSKNRPADTITLSLGYRPPYRWTDMLRFLAGRAIGGVETVQGGEYLRTVSLPDAAGVPVCGWVRVGQDQRKNALTVTLSDSLLPVVPQVLARVRRLFDLNCDPQTIFEALAPMNALLPDSCIEGTRLPGCFDAFEMAVRAVLGQQITVRAASTLAARLVGTYGVPIETGIDGLTHTFPAPQTLLALGDPIENHLGPLGITAARARTIRALAEAFVEGTVDFTHCAQPETEMHKLMQIKGIGSWTAQYIAMRAMAWPDAFLETDAGIKKALQSYTSKEIIQLAEAWRPWRSYATINLWNTL